MSEPLTSSVGGATTVAGMTMVGLLSGIDAEIVIGAFAGSVLFVISASEYGTYTKIMLFIVSIIAGVLSADFVAAMITTFTPEGILVSRPLGALVSSVIAVRLLIFMGMRVKDDPLSIMNKLKGKKPNG